VRVRGHASTAARCHLDWSISYSSFDEQDAGLPPVLLTANGEAAAHGRHFFTQGAVIKLSWFPKPERASQRSKELERC
jgi:hypothetical protein